MFSTRTSMDVGMVHCVPESTCTYVAIYREAMESVETLRNKEGQSMTLQQPRSFHGLKVYCNRHHIQ